jgi:hypothetical protein
MSGGDGGHELAMTDDCPLNKEGPFSRSALEEALVDPRRCVVFCVSIYLYIYAYTYVCVCVYIYMTIIYTYIYIYTCIYVYIYIYYTYVYSFRFRLVGGSLPCPTPQYKSELRSTACV